MNTPNSSRDSECNISPAGCRPGAPAFSNSGSHLLRSDSGAGTSSFSCRMLNLPQSLTLRLPIGGYRKRGALQRPVWQPQAGYSRSLNAVSKGSWCLPMSCDVARKGRACHVPEMPTADCIQGMAKKSCPVLEHKQDGMGKRLRSGPEMWVRVLNGQVSQRLLQNCVLRTPNSKGIQLQLSICDRCFLPQPDNRFKNQTAVKKDNTYARSINSSVRNQVATTLEATSLP